jgi:hypothetical protein
MKCMTEILLLKHRAPFDVSLCTLFIMAVIMMCTWDENYGDKTGNFIFSLQDAMAVIQNGIVYYTCMHVIEVYKKIGR